MQPTVTIKRLGWLAAATIVLGVLIGVGAGLLTLLLYGVEHVLLGYIEGPELPGPFGVPAARRAISVTVGLSIAGIIWYLVGLLWCLTIIGIPVGLLLGYGIGAVLTPIALETTSIIGTKAAISSSPLIFIGSAVFAIITVFLSCRKPGKMAAKVSPVEAAKYTEGMTGKRKNATAVGLRYIRWLLPILAEIRRKLILVVVSLTLSVTLLNVLFSLVNGFDMDKYVDRSTCADFIVSSTDYFRYNTAGEYIGADTIDEIKENTDETVSGSGYDLADISPYDVDGDRPV